MTKTQLVREIAAKIDGCTQKDVSLVLDVLQDVVKESVAAGEKITLTGFLTFDKKHVPAKTGTSSLGGVEKEWFTEAHDEITVKLSKSYKTI